MELQIAGWYNLYPVSETLRKGRPHNFIDTYCACVMDNVNGMSMEC